MSFEIPKDQKLKLIEKIQSFFLNEREEEIGIIAAESILDFFIAEIGVKLYNKGLDDSKRWLNKKLGELEIDFDLLYQTEN